MRKLLKVFLFLVAFNLFAVPPEAQKIFDQVCRTITYDLEHDHIVYGREFWQLPGETEALKRGDCEDLALLLQYRFLQAGIESYLVVLESPTIKGATHVMVRLGAWTFDPSIHAVFDSAALSKYHVYAVLSYSAALELLRTRR